MHPLKNNMSELGSLSASRRPELTEERCRYRNTLIFSEHIPSRLALIENLLARLFHHLAPLCCNGERREELEIALREALANAIRHGNRNNAEKQVHLRCYMLESSELLFVVRDQGEGFDPSRIADPTSAANLHRDSGRGIFLIRHFMDSVEFRHNGTEIRMYKRC